MCDLVELKTDNSVSEHTFGYFVVTNWTMYAARNVIQIASQEPSIFLYGFIAKIVKWA